MCGMGGLVRSRLSRTIILRISSRIRARLRVSAGSAGYFTMNARPLAVMDSLRFGPLDEAEPDEALRRRNHQIATGVIHGVAGIWELFWGSRIWVGNAV